LSKKQEYLNPDDPSDIGDAWIWRAIALPSHLRVITHLSHDRSEEEAITFLAAFKGIGKDSNKKHTDRLVRRVRMWTLHIIVEVVGPDM
jgi:uncharacterized protein YchJ